MYLWVGVQGIKLSLAIIIASRIGGGFSIAD